MVGICDFSLSLFFFPFFFWSRRKERVEDWIKRFRYNRKVPGSNRTGCLVGRMDPTHYEAPGDFLVE